MESAAARSAQGREAAMSVIIGMFRELARLGVSRAAAFFYAVAVGVAANIIIAHFSPHESAATAPPAAWPLVAKPGQSPMATAIIAPKPAEPPAHGLEVNAPATIPIPAPAIKPATIATPALPAIANQPAGGTPTAASLPSPAAMTPPPLQPTALPSAAAPPPVAPSSAALDAKPADKPANNVEAATTPAAPVSLLPPSDQPAPKPIKPGPGSGGLY
jgi:hypothetical protein